MPDKLIRLEERLRQQGIEHALLCSAESLRYFCGYSSSIETGISPFFPLSGALLWIQGHAPVFFLADMESAEKVPNVESETFLSYTVDRPLGAIRDLGDKMLAHFRGAASGKIGIEADHLPAALLERLSASCPNLLFRDVTSVVSALRTIKDEQEIETIRRAVALCDVGQKTAKQTLRSGISEIELFEEVRRQMEIAAGARLPLLADLVSGPRTAGVGGPPTSRKIETGDCVLVDLAPRLNGYWGDSCNTFVAGEPTPQQKKLFAEISAALAESMSKIRPGLPVSAIDSGLRKRLATMKGIFPHHSGHGLGVAYHEEPRIVPYNQIPFQENMVIALEPGVYFPAQWGMRLEYVLRITNSGTELLTQFHHVL